MKAKNVYHRYRDQAMKRDAEDFLGQVSRTINGQPIDQAQHELLVEAVLSGLLVQPDDVVLDLCCGNGLISDRVFSQCRGGIGVDFSDYLIDVARKHFQRDSGVDYVLSDVVKYVSQSSDTNRFTKALCYGSFAYLDFDDAAALLTQVHDRYANVVRMFIGNLPDKGRLREFYYDRQYVESIENDNDTAIGIWRTESEFIDLAKTSGWKAAIVRMPETFFASHYRYDVILTRA